VVKYDRLARKGVESQGKDPALSAVPLSVGQGNAGCSNVLGRAKVGSTNRSEPC